MLRNYLTVAIRNLLESKTESFINIFGLAFGLMCMILISKYLGHEWSYDAFHENKDNLFRVVQVTKNLAGDYEYSSPSSILLAPALNAELPEIANYLRVSGPDNAVVRYEDVILNQRLLFVDPSLFEMFTFPLIEGQPESVLSDSRSVVITSEVAYKLFGDTPALGKRLTLEVNGEDLDFFIAGISESPPSNSTIQFDLVVRLDQRELEENWVATTVYTYVQLDQNSDPAALDGKFLAFTQRHYGSIIERRQNPTRSIPESYRLSADEDAMTHQLQPLREVYLHLPWVQGVVSEGKPVYSFILVGITVLILLIACINFTGLAIARSMRRTKEVGVRKVIGAARMNLIMQFLGEAFIMVILAAGLGWLLAGCLTPVVSLFAGYSIDLPGSFGIEVLSAGIIIIVLISLLAGSYPAMVISTYQPVTALSNKVRHHDKNLFVRTLVTLQFAISIFFICATFIMWGQLHFIRTADTGFNRENVLVLSGTGLSFYSLDQAERSQRTLQLLRPELMRVPGVIDLSPAPSLTGYGGWFMVGWTGENGEMWSSSVYRVDTSFVNLLELEFLEGRFPEARTTGASYEVIVNESFVKEYGLEAPVTGQILEGLGMDGNDVIISGVIRDYNFRSFHFPVEPLILENRPDRAFYDQLLVKIDGQQINRTLAGIEEVWQEIMPDQPFQYSFLDEDIAGMYSDESRWTSVIAISSAAAILITCMGLFGMVSLAAASRTKEIGIRKVVGASVAQVVTLLSKEFLVLVLIANVIAWPVAWYAMHRWLENFAYRIELGVGMFILSGLLALFIALITVSWQTLRAATANPVEALRYE